MGEPASSHSWAEANASRAKRLGRYEWFQNRPPQPSECAWLSGYRIRESQSLQSSPFPAPEPQHGFALAAPTLRPRGLCLFPPSCAGVGSGNRFTFSAGEQCLSEWMDENARVVWKAVEEPWKLEEKLISILHLPLDLDQDAANEFFPILSALRKAARLRAKALAILPDDGTPECHRNRLQSATCHRTKSRPCYQ